jgi:carbonic anhydrase
VPQRVRHLPEQNRRWAEATKAREPGFFTRLAQQQTPRYSSSKWAT